ncbi:MAG: hypothetical protein LC777_08785, partial [Actinobacteria bacterium]|nr:hypothetical protein [Actinomycetota bacterium]
ALSWPYPSYISQGSVTPRRQRARRQPTLSAQAPRTAARVYRHPRPPPRPRHHRSLHSAHQRRSRPRACHLTPRTPPRLTSRRFEHDPV